MNVAVEFVTGRCTNTLFCAAASDGEMLRLPAGARFVCGQCGKALVPMSERAPRSPLFTGIVFGLGMVATGGGLLAIATLFLGNPAPPALAPAPVPALTGTRPAQTATRSTSLDPTPYFRAADNLQKSQRLRHQN